jgi:hypothetical protein
MRRICWSAAVILAACTLLPISGVSAQADSYAPVRERGWYGGSPPVHTYCSVPHHLAHGSDGGRMDARACIGQTGPRSFQSYVWFQNYSTSSATAHAFLNMEGATADQSQHFYGRGYTASSHLLPAAVKPLPGSIDIYVAGYNEQGIDLPSTGHPPLPGGIWSTDRFDVNGFGDSGTSIEIPTS